ncbi:hypothetical protein BSK43_006950 [Rhizobium sp. P44RR-XXIV]|nr:hypothetical protein BSK43_006950 [Rhizobium sp. P44RR-XXIV]
MIEAEMPRERRIKKEPDAGGGCVGLLIRIGNWEEECCQSMKERWEEECASFETNRYNAGAFMKRQAFAMQQCNKRIAFTRKHRKCRISPAIPVFRRLIYSRRIAGIRDSHHRDRKHRRTMSPRFAARRRRCFLRRLAVVDWTIGLC